MLCYRTGVRRCSSSCRFGALSMQPARFQQSHAMGHSTLASVVQRGFFAKTLLPCRERSHGPASSVHHHGRHLVTDVARLDDPVVRLAVVEVHELRAVPAQQRFVDCKPQPDGNLGKDDAGPEARCQGTLTGPHYNSRPPRTHLEQVLALREDPLEATTGRKVLGVRLRAGSVWQGLATARDGRGRQAVLPGLAPSHLEVAGQLDHAGAETRDLELGRARVLLVALELHGRREVGALAPVPAGVEEAARTWKWRTASSSSRP